MRNWSRRGAPNFCSEPTRRAAAFSAIRDLFDRLSTGCARFTGRPAMLIVCLTLAATGISAFASSSELFISGANISISIVTLLLLPILQATQNRDGAALQTKIDELIKVNTEARDGLIGLEDRSEEKFSRPGETSREASLRRATSRGTPHDWQAR